MSQINQLQKDSLGNSDKYMLNRSHVTCQMLRVSYVLFSPLFLFIFDKVVILVDRGSVIIGATPSSFVKKGFNN